MEGTDHFTDVKHQGTKYKKDEITSYQTSTTISSRIASLTYNFPRNHWTVKKAGPETKEK